MNSEERTYQPGWGEEKKKPHHHHSHSYQQERDSNRRLGGALRMRDKQAYYGLVLAAVLVALVGVFSVVKLFVKELRSMPMDDPTAELKVDELRIHKVDEHDALLAGDSLAQALELDSSMIRHVQKETTPVYRPPRKNNEWYITQREWKDIMQNIKRWKKDNQQ